MSHAPESYGDAIERQLGEIVTRLEAERPLPRPGFRGELRRRLISDPPSPSPRRARMLVFAYSASGIVLLAVTAIGLAGVGPLAAG